MPSIIQTLDGVIGESEKEVRRYLTRFVPRDVWEKIKIQELNEHTNPKEIEHLLKSGERWGLISDAGLPCIADPGAPLVALARRKQMEIEAVVGPCSLILALQLSGLEGQRFSFHGYLPRDAAELKAKLIELERVSKKERATQIFIEAPYRSPKLFQTLLETLQPKTLLCVAQNLTAVAQRVNTQSIADWRHSNTVFEKGPAIFLLLDH